MKTHHHLHGVLLVTATLLSTALLGLPTRTATAYGEGALPAFPGAEGFGAYTVGGRGGRVIEVTNLSDSGNGSLRACVVAQGPRICVFRTGGLIQLDTSLTVTQPYITIAGQTAPGGGITLKPAGSNGFTLLNIQTHDVILRYISSRPGPGGSNNALLIAHNGTPIYNIVVDHCSFSWATDEVLTTWYRVYDTTIQWSIISEGLDCSTHPKGCHSKGLMVGGYAGSESKDGIGSENITAHHNLIVHNGERGPLVQVCGVAQMINNVTYNSYWTFSHQQDNCIIPNTPSTVNWIGNYHKRGSDSTSNTDLKMIPSDEGNYSGGGRIYVKGNIGPSRTDDGQPESYWVDSGSRSHIVTSPAPAPSVNATDALTAYEDVLVGAGNNRGLACDGSWFDRRDSIDTRIVNDVKNGTGHIIDDPSEVGGWITPVSGTACPDGDHDGMPEEWELAIGLDPASDDSALDQDHDGYTNIEEYLNGTGNAFSPSFADVPPDHPYFAQIEALYRAGYTAGCATDPLRYCPDQTMNRAESAVFIERGIHTATYDPAAPALQIFADMPLDSWAAKWVHGLWEDQYTAGCGTNPLVYCPWQGHTRAEGCVFYLRMLDGATFDPPQPAGQTFTDVPLDAWYAKWVQAAYDAGLIPACQTSPELTFCPNDPLTRALAAYMMVQAKGLLP